MKLIFGIVLIILSQNLQSQTDSITINSFRNVEEWQTKKSVLDSIFRVNYQNKTGGFLADFERYFSLSNYSEDNWYANYLVAVEIKDGIMSIDFKNHPLKSDKMAIEHAFLSTNINWSKSTDVKLNLVVSKYELSQIKIKEFENAYLQLVYDIGYYKFPFSCKECCRNSKSETLTLVQECIMEEEYYSAIHYLKQLNRIYPFDMQINDQLKFALSKIKEIE